MVYFIIFKLKYKMPKKIIFLYPELTPYFMGCLNVFSDHSPKINLHIVYDKVFEKVLLKNNPKYSLTQKDEFQSKKDLYFYCFNLKPSAIIISGRMYSEYLYVAKKMKNVCTRVTVQDTIYSKSFKKLITRNLSFFLYKRYFDKFWGVGDLQRKFALDIGYQEQNIYDGFYVADKIFFEASKKNEFSKNNTTFLFIGRLVEEKNILRLVRLIESINHDENVNHKINIIGSGYLKDKILKYKCVNYKGSLNQRQIIDIANDSDVFCLPSIYEPWGVVTHEMVALGLPVLISNKCGSGDLVKNEINGFKFDPLNDFSIISAIKKFTSLSNSQKKDFSLNSIKISKTITHTLWNKTLLSLTVKA